MTAAGDALPDHSVNTGFGKNVSVLMGSNFADNKGNATFYLTYDKAAAVLEAKYDYAACVLDATKAAGWHAAVRNLGEEWRRRLLSGLRTVGMRCSRTRSMARPAHFVPLPRPTPTTSVR